MAAMIEAAGRILKETGCQAVKLEGLDGHEDVVSHILGSGLPVMGHLGLTPQSVNVMGGFKTQGRKQAEWAAIEADAE